jgi:deazaflavin-dependent oxidoreductase (nitroreductase family)
LHSAIKRRTQNPYLIFAVYNILSNDDLYQKMNNANEITLGIKGRKSGKDIPRPVWFVHEDNALYLLPVQGSDTNWYKNILANPMLMISANRIKVPATGKPITDRKKAEEIVRKFKSKYGEGDVKKYYTKFDVAVEVPL